MIMLIESGMRWRLGKMCLRIKSFEYCTDGRRLVNYSVRNGFDVENKYRFVSKDKWLKLYHLVKNKYPWHIKEDINGVMRWTFYR